MPYFSLCYGLCLAAVANQVAAVDLELRPVADTTLHAVSPANNMGGHTHVAIGSTAKNTPARGLFRFDLSAIPTNAAISAVTITFTFPALNRPDTTNALYSMHRMLKPWGEGTKTGNLGTTATAGEASWQSSAVPTLWTVPGGGAGTDYAETASATQLLGPSPGVYPVPSNAALIADLKHWIETPSENFGWLLKAEDESQVQTARQVASRETGNGALLHVEYSVGAAGELRITTIERVNTNVVIRWTGGQGNIGIEKTDLLSSSWQTAGQSADGSFTNAATGTQQFFRLKQD